MSKFIWIGLAGIATAGGVVFHSDVVRETLENAEYAIGERNATFEEEMAKLEPKIASGELSRSKAIDLAIENTIASSTGADPDDPESTPSVAITLGGDGEGAGNIADAVSEARGRLDETEQQVEALRQAGAISQEQYSEALIAIQEAEAKVGNLLDE